MDKGRKHGEQNGPGAGPRGTTWTRRPPTSPAIELSTLSDIVDEQDAAYRIARDDQASCSRVNAHEWTIGKCGDGQPESGKDFVLYSVLTRSTSAPGHVLLYKKQRVARVLLSSVGLEAFNAVRANITRDQMQPLRDPNGNNPPTELIRNLLTAGCKGSLTVAFLLHRSE